MNESNKKRLVGIFLLFLLLLIPKAMKAPGICGNVFYIFKEEPIYWSQEQQELHIWNVSYEAMILSLKQTEGFRDRPYKDAHGKSVGYGHFIKRTDHFSYPMSEEFADSLLRADFNHALEYVKSTTTLKKNKLLAISHFVFCLGKGNFEKSTLKKKILLKHSIDYEIMRWTNITTDKGIIQSSFLKKLRKMELELYKSST